MIIESTRSAPNQEGSSNRIFGFFFAFFFLLIAMLPLLKGASIRFWAVIPSLFFLLSAWWFPQVLTWPNRLWTRLGILMGAVVSPVALAIIFFLVVTPLGLYLRFSKKITMCADEQHQSHTYWIERLPPGPDPQQMSRQF